ncbi:MAG: hypothetical protein J7M24_00245, partial [Candidatus Latescibacteria bacterium]|nr:hypothetical protein [Candidatus Latescibacterota bacterium]
PDELRCLNIILEHVVEYMVERDRIRRSVGQIVISDPMSAGGKEAIELLGIKVMWTNENPRIDDKNYENYLVISNSHSGIAKILRETPWAKAWNRVLKRISEEKTFERNVKFSGTTHRGTFIPFSEIFENENINDDDK